MAELGLHELDNSEFPGKQGRKLDTYHIPDDLRIGTVGLNIRDKDSMLDFYHRFLGLEILGTDGNTTLLGFESEGPLLGLNHKPDAIDRPGNTAGLYHFALLTPNRGRLAYALYRLVQERYPLQGAADHFVSEAIYLADPEGNGIEIYADRPRDEWQWEDGKLRMGTAALNAESLLAEGAALHEASTVLSPGTTVGHIHLQVSDLREAMTFYGEILGFDSMGLYGSSAAFYSAGGYHHHIGLNTWASAGGPRSAAGMRGLSGYELIFPASDAIEDLRQTLDGRGQTISREADGLRLEDPFGIRIRIRKEHGIPTIT